MSNDDVKTAPSAVRAVAIIQARMGSSRLAGKSMAHISGLPLIGHVIERSRACRHVNEVVLATTTAVADDVLAEYCHLNGLGCFRGSINDVLDRYYQAARQSQAEVVVRITADDPFKDPDVIDEVITAVQRDPTLDYASNTLVPTFPEGLDVEVVRFSALKRAWQDARKVSEREHVTPYIWQHPELFRLRNITYHVDLSGLRWTIDYDRDLEFARAVYARLYRRGHVFKLTEILSLLEREPALGEINAGFARNAGYLKSLQQEERKVMRITSREQEYVQKVLENQFRNSVSAGMTKRMEEAFAERFQSKFAISFANGTATMHAALVAAGVGPGHEVIVPPLTMASTAFCVLQAGAIPVFADVHPDNWTMDPVSVAERITPRTKAIIPVAIYGLPADMDPLMELTKKYNLFVLEDDAQCFLGYYRGRIAGSIGHASSFSFQSSKHISCGEGGMITTNDEALATEIRRLGSLGYGAVSAGAGKSKITRETIQDPAYLRHTSIGWNYRLSEICSAVILGQIERIEELVQTRLDSAKALAEATHGCSWLVAQMTPADCVHSYWTYVCRLTPEAPCTWYEFRRKYAENGGDGIYAAWALNYLEPAMRGKKFGAGQWQEFETGLCPVAERLQPRLLQFKTNYFDSVRRQRAADALRRTIAAFK